MGSSSGKKGVSQLEKNLPEWDLTDFYKSIYDPAIERELKELAKKAESFKKQFEGKILKATAEQLASALGEYEKIQEASGKLGSYAQLIFAGQMNDPKIAQFYQNISEKLTALASTVLFFTLDLNKLEDGALKLKMAHPKLKRFAPWIRDVRSWRPYQLSDELEKILLDKSIAGRAAWIRLFDETLTNLRFPMGTKKLTEPEVMDLMSSADGAKRKQAALSVGETFKANSSTFTLITNTLAKDKEIEDRWRKFKQPISSRNASNYIEDEVVQALMDTVAKNYKNLSHRYYALKASWFKKKQLDYWDRNAPLPFDDDRNYSWATASELVLTAYKQFSPAMAKTGEQFFNKNWIDVPVKPGKSPGAFAHPTVPSVHPYLLLNYQGKSRDVMTLAHELGHGVHQVLSNKQGALMCDTPLTLAETASVFGEQLAFREMLRREKNIKLRKAMIATKVEDMLNTVVRQVAFCRFEQALHGKRQQGELTADQICEIWMEMQSESLGPAIKLHGNYKYFWSYIPHFIHTPFYVYAYAFGDCLVNSLYAVYEQESKKGNAKAFEQKYIAMLEAGGTLRHKELLKPFGLDASKPDFWQKGLNIISGFIDELE